MAQPLGTRRPIPRPRQHPLRWQAHCAGLLRSGAWSLLLISTWATSLSEAGAAAIDSTTAVVARQQVHFGLSDDGTPATLKVTWSVSDWATEPLLVHVPSALCEGDKTAAGSLVQVHLDLKDQRPTRVSRRPPASDHFDCIFALEADQGDLLQGPFELVLEASLPASPTALTQLPELRGAPLGTIREGQPFKFQLTVTLPRTSRLADPLPALLKPQETVSDLQVWQAELPAPLRFVRLPTVGNQGIPIAQWVDRGLVCAIVLSLLGLTWQLLRSAPHNAAQRS